MIKPLQKSFLFISLFCILPSCYRILPSDGGGQISKTPVRQINVNDILVPDGYKVELVATGLTFPTAITFDDNGTPYVIESGYSYGEIFLEPKLFRIEKNGDISLIASGEKNGPWNGITHYNGNFYVAEGGQLMGGRILKINNEGKIQVIVDSLPSLGDHHTNGPVIKDGYIYFGQGTATNSGVVGKDNSDFGWLKRFPDFHDVPCKDITVQVVNFTSPNPLTDNKNDEAITGPFSPFNHKIAADNVIKGTIPCNGAIMRVPVDGGETELVAWGLRNPYGLALSPDNELYVTENSYDVRGSRPVWGTGDVLWKIEEGKWYGWPDFSAGIPIQEFKVPGEDDPLPVLAKHPNKPPHPVAKLGVHSSSNGMAFPKRNFDDKKYAFIAQFGDMAPGVGKVLSPVGFKVIKVNIENGVVQDFAANKGDENGPASYLKNGGLERPVSVQFSPEGELYIVDFGIMTTGKKGPEPQTKTGVIWKVTKEK